MSKKKLSRLIIVQGRVVPTEHHSAIYNFLHEAGHDIHSFDEKAHHYLDELGHRLIEEGHEIHQVYDKLNSKDNYADYQIMPGHNRQHRIESMRSTESMIYKLYPDAKIDWGLEKGKNDPADNTSFMQSFRVSNVTLGDIVTINNLIMQYGGGFK